MDEATRYFVYSYCETVAVLNKKPRVIPTETTCGFHRKHAWFKNEAFVFVIFINFQKKSFWDWLIGYNFIIIELIF
jgi:hypothetical protein